MSRKYKGKSTVSSEGKLDLPVGMIARNLHLAVHITNWFDEVEIAIIIEKRVGKRIEIIQEIPVPFELTQRFLEQFRTCRTKVRAFHKAADKKFGTDRALERFQLYQPPYKPLERNYGQGELNFR